MADADPLTHEIIGAAMAVSKLCGTGLLESVYEGCLANKLLSLGFQVERQPTLSASFGVLRFEGAFRPDLVVARSVIVEAKAVSTFLPIHQAQILTYLRLSPPHGPSDELQRLPVFKRNKAFHPVVICDICDHPCHLCFRILNLGLHSHSIVDGGLDETS